MDYKTLFPYTNKLSVLLVEDYEPLRNDMEEILENLFKKVIVASDGQEALNLYIEYHAAYNKTFDLVITDIQMPMMDGVKLSEAIRKIKIDQQVIVLSANTDSANLLKLINLGIAQFITKPLQHKELLNTLYNVSKKITTQNKEEENGYMIDLGENHSWDKEKSILKKYESIISLTRYELLVLKLMLRKTEQVCSNEDIIQEFYVNDIDMSEKNIRNLLSKLRKKLPEKLITSLYGIGYKLTLIN